MLGRAEPFSVGGRPFFAFGPASDERQADMRKRAAALALHQLRCEADCEAQMGRWRASLSIRPAAENRPAAAERMAALRARIAAKYTAR